MFIIAGDNNFSKTFTALCWLALSPHRYMIVPLEKDRDHFHAHYKLSESALKQVITILEYRDGYLKGKKVEEICIYNIEAILHGLGISEHIECVLQLTYPSVSE